MNKLNLLKLMFLVVTVLGSNLMYAQSDNVEIQENTEVQEVETAVKFNDYLYISGDLGLGLLDGDNTKFKLGYNGHIGVGYQFDKYIGLKLNLGYGSLNASLDNITIDKLNYLEANASFTFDLTNIIFGYNPDRKFSVVPHIGLGQIQYRLDALNNDGSIYYRVGYRDDKKKTDGGINGRKIVATVPFGLELDYALTSNWDIFFDFTTNYTDSDLLEGVNGDYKNDWFYSFNLGANYRFNRIEKTSDVFRNFFNSNTEYCNYWYIMVDGGASFLFGDNKFNFSSLKANYNIGAGYNFKNYYRVYAKIGSGSYTGQNNPDWVITDGDFINANINVAADVIGLFSSQEQRIGLYPHVGIGQTQYRATTYERGVGTKQLGYDNQESYNTKGDGLNGRRVALTFPLGIELVYNVNERTDFYADATSYLTQSDLLDCIVSGTNNDSYSTLNVGLRYKFNKVCVYGEVDKYLTPDEVKDAVKEAIQQQKAEEDAAAAQEEPKACITPEELKQAIKDAIQEYENSKPEDKTSCLSNATVINNNYSDIAFPKNGAQKVKTQTNIDAINRASDQVDNGSAVNRVIIEGYASPEGSKDFNERLARERAEQAAEIIKNELGDIDAERIEITTKGADWEGLYASLANSDIEDKDSIIEQLKNSSNQVETLQELLNTYPQIRQLLPQLRRASIVITTVK